jgi:hypothetical protein
MPTHRFLPTLATALCLAVLPLAATPAAATPPPAPAACSLFGTVVGIGDADALSPVIVGSGALAFVDDGSGFFSPGEPVYLDSNADAIVSPSDVRITGASGSVVAAGDTDVGAPLTALPGNFAFSDADGSGSYNAGDPFYWDTDSSGTVSVTDLRFTPSTGGAAGTTVRLGDADLNNPLLVPFASFSFIDVDGNGLFTRVDALYIHAAFGFGLAFGDVRLSGFPTALAAEPVVHLAPVPLGALAPAFRATLQSTATGAPVAGAAVAFYVAGDLVCSAPTDGAGTAACGSLAEKALAITGGGYTARYAGSFPYCGSEATGPVI